MKNNKAKPENEDEENTVSLLDMLKLEIKMKNWQFLVVIIFVFSLGVLVN